VGVNQELLRKMKERNGQPLPSIREVGNPAVKVKELEDIVQKQDERIQELEQMVIKLFNMVQMDYMERVRRVV
jgi:hypothetical protein